MRLFLLCNNSSIVNFIMSDTRAETIQHFQQALNNQVEIHVWRGTQSPWMRQLVVKPGTEVDPDPGYSPDFIKATGVAYGGIMSADEIQQRLDAFTQYSDQ